MAPTHGALCIGLLLRVGSGASLVIALERELKLSSIEVRYLPVTSATRHNAIADGWAALDCGSTTNIKTLEHVLWLQVLEAQDHAKVFAMVRDSFKYPGDKVSDFSG